MKPLTFTHAMSVVPQYKFPLTTSSLKFEVKNFNSQTTKGDVKGNGTLHFTCSKNKLGGHPNNTIHYVDIKKLFIRKHGHLQEFL